MSKFDKLVQKIWNGKNVSYEDAENVLLNLGFELKIRGSHHNFRKPKYHKTISIKKKAFIAALSNKRFKGGSERPWILKKV